LVETQAHKATATDNRPHRCVLSVPVNVSWSHYHGIFVYNYVTFLGEMFTNSNTVELLHVELQGKQKNIRVEIIFLAYFSGEFTMGLCPSVRKTLI
jgi:hypothetical protein